MESREDVLHHVAENIRQPEIAAFVTPDELLVVEAALMQQRGVQLVDVNGIFQGTEADFGRRPHG